MKIIFAALVFVVLANRVVADPSAKITIDLNFVNDYIELIGLKNSGELIYGIGSAKLSSISMSTKIAETRAREDIARKANSLVQISKNEATGEVVTIALSKAEITGSTIFGLFIGNDKTVWLIIAADKANIKVLE